MASPPTLFHTLLRPAVLQILRAQGFHATRTSVIDAMTDLAARYLYGLCAKTSHHMQGNDASEGEGLIPTLVDVRMALEDFGAFLPQTVFEEQEWAGKEDVGAVADFIKWFSGPKNREIKRIALDGDEENSDYLSALKKRHSKMGEDSKFNGTALGRAHDHGEITVEGGEFSSIQLWQVTRSKERQQSPQPLPLSVTPEGDSRPPSSGLSSIGDRTIGEDMDLS